VTAHSGFVAPAVRLRFAQPSPAVVAKPGVITILRVLFIVVYRVEMPHSRKALVHIKDREFDGVPTAY